MKSKIDYTTISERGLTEEGSFDKRWWRLSSENRPSAITKIVKHLSEQDSRRQLQYSINARLYGNYSVHGANGLAIKKQMIPDRATKDRVTYNAVQSVVDTINAKMAKNKPKSAFLTSGGDYKLQRKAKKLEKFCDGIRYENHGHEMGVEAFRDAEVFGDGLIHVFAQHNRVKWERAFASELFVDPVEAYYGCPRSLYRVKNIDREVLIELFPEQREQIENAPAAEVDSTETYQQVSDQVTVSEAWHLPSGPEAKDGLHIISIETAELFQEEYKRSYFPFAKLSWSKGLTGFWAQGIPEQLQSIQLEINKISWVIQRSMHLSGTFKVWIKTGSKIVKEHLNNDIGAIINSDEPPTYLLPPIVQPELVARRESLKQEAFEQVGVSQLSASSQKPAGLNSGKALREYNDIESDRFMTIGQAYEQFFLTLDRLSIDVGQEIYQATKNFSVKVPGKKFLETIDWKDINLEGDEFLMKAYPVSALPDEPAERLQTVIDYMQAGLYSADQGKKLLDFPDLEAEDSKAIANENWVTDVLEKIVDNNEYTPPEPEMDLTQAKNKVLQFIAEAHTNGLEEEKIESLRLFNSQLDALTMKAMPPAPPQIGPQPQAVPSAPPVSDMLPNAPGGAA